MNFTMTSSNRGVNKDSRWFLVLPFLIAKGFAVAVLYRLWLEGSVAFWIELARVIILSVFLIYAMVRSNYQLFFVAAIPATFTDVAWLSLLLNVQITKGVL
jgi:hypothetical protein